jgi:pimeloyl-ACP methyl ester carboxylesterase
MILRQLDTDLTTKVETGMRVKSADGTWIAYDNQGSGPLLLLIDGALAYRKFRGGRELAAALAHDFTVVTYDRRGRGESTDTQPHAVAREVEDIWALIAESGGSAALYGFSSGAVLALHAAAALGVAVTKLALLEPPFGADDEAARRESLAYGERVAARLAEGDRAGALGLFLGDMLPPEALEGLRDTPLWPVLEAVAPTLAYDNTLLGDGAVPLEVAGAVTAPALVLDGTESPDFKRSAADSVARALRSAERRTLASEDGSVPVAVLAPALRDFLR